MRVAKTAIAAGRQAKTLALGNHIDDHCLGIFLEDLRADRNLQRHIAAAGARAVAAHAVNARAGLEMLLKAEIDQCVQAVDGLHPDVAATATIAAIRTAELDEFLAPETTQRQLRRRRTGYRLLFRQEISSHCHLFGVFAATIAAIDIGACSGGQRIS